MADRSYLVANPTEADVIVAGASPTTAVKGQVTVILADDVTAEIEGFLTAGCAVQRSDILDESERQEGGFLLNRHSA